MKYFPSIFVTSPTFFMRHRSSCALLFTWPRSGLFVGTIAWLAIQRVFLGFSITGLWHSNCRALLLGALEHLDVTSGLGRFGKQDASSQIPTSLGGPVPSRR